MGRQPERGEGHTSIPVDTIIHGDACMTLHTLPPACIDAIVTDPPAGISFMGKAFDHHRGGRDQWIAWLVAIMREAVRVLKPGGHALVWSLPRTSHWTATALEDAGFEIRDCLYHLFGNGFPKSHDISKAIDRQAGKEREILGTRRKTPYSTPQTNAGWKRPSHQTEASPEIRNRMDITVPATPLAMQWDGWGSALKPSVEQWILCRKPLAACTLAENVLTYGTGGLNIAATRVAMTEHVPHHTPGRAQSPTRYHRHGRYPSHLLLSHSLFCEEEHCAEGCPVAELDRQSENSASRYFQIFSPEVPFLYVAKATRRERNAGCERLPEQVSHRYSDMGHGPLPQQTPSVAKPEQNTHPTVKPLALMRYLVRLITPPGGLVLDCFAGSGSTLVAALQEGRHFLGIEQEGEYVEIGRARIAFQQGGLS